MKTKFVYISGFRTKQNGVWRWVHGKRGYFRVLKIPAESYVPNKHYTLSHKGVTEVYASRDVDTGTQGGKYGVYNFKEYVESFARIYNESPENQVNE